MSVEESKGRKDVIKAFVFDAYGTLYDVQSVSSVINRKFPGHGEYICQVWRMKQLEYTWLRSMMGRYEDFWAVTRESLAYALQTVGLSADGALFDDIAEGYNRLSPYPDAEEALNALQSYRCAILSNGSPAMLDALVANSGFDHLIKTVMSVDGKSVFKPDPRSYEVVGAAMGIAAKEVVFVSSNGFDVAGAKSFGFRVARIERVPPAVLKSEMVDTAMMRPLTMFKATRMQAENIGYEPDFVVASLSELPSLVRKLEIDTPDSAESGAYQRILARP